ncbi:MAG: hypothetical protein E6767_20605 [Dysgonomonas sp.]|nr:hypothetical protein [Dysgonomonas sp.]
MHFQVFKDNLYSKLINLLALKVPEFQSVFDEGDGVYPIFGEFARFIMMNSDNQKIINESFDFINIVIEDGGADTEDVVVTELYEQFYYNSKIEKISREKLSEKALNLFDKYHHL